MAEICALLRAQKGVDAAVPGQPFRTPAASPALQLWLAVADDSSGRLGPAGEQPLGEGEGKNESLARYTLVARQGMLAQEVQLSGRGLARDDVRAAAAAVVKKLAAPE